VLYTVPGCRKSKQTPPPGTISTYQLPFVPSLRPSASQLHPGNLQLAEHRSHLPTLRNDNVRSRLLRPKSSVLHLPHDIHAIDDFAEDDVLVVQERCGHGGDEELGAVGVWTGVLNQGKTLDCW